MNGTLGAAILELARAVADLRRDTDEVHRRLSNVVRVGKVHQIDPNDPLRVRIDLMPGETAADPFLSDWVPLAQFGGAGGFEGDGKNGNAATLKTSLPTAVGSDVYLVSPNGEPGVGFAVPVSYNDQNKPPGARPDAAVFNYGNAQLRLANGSIDLQVDGAKLNLSSSSFKVEIGGASVELTPAAFQMIAELVKAEGASLMHNAKSVGDKHGHESAPPGPPGPPVG